MLKPFNQTCLKYLKFNIKNTYQEFHIYFDEQQMEELQIEQSNWFVDSFHEILTIPAKIGSELQAIENPEIPINSTILFSGPSWWNVGGNVVKLICKWQLTRFLKIIWSFHLVNSLSVHSCLCCFHRRNLIMTCFSDLWIVRLSGTRIKHI